MTNIMQFPGASDFTCIRLGTPPNNGTTDNRILIFGGSVSNATGILALLQAAQPNSTVPYIPPLGSLFINKYAGAVSIWMHTTSSTTPATSDWTQQANISSTYNTILTNLLNIIGVTPLTATSAEMNILHSSGLTAAQMVLLSLVTSGSDVVQHLTTTVTAAMLAAGNATLISGVTGKSIYVLDYAITPLSTMSGTGITGLVLQDNAGTPKVVDTTTTLTLPIYPWSASAHTLVTANFKQALTVAGSLVLGAMAQASKANFVCASGVLVDLTYVIK